MIDGLLFILVIINFAITITLYISYSRNNVSELKDEISVITDKFNRDAERNIQILEDRTKVLETLLKNSDSVLGAMKRANSSNGLSISKLSLRNSFGNYNSESQEADRGSLFTGDDSSVREKRIADNGSLSRDRGNSPNKKTYIQKAYSVSKNSYGANQVEDDVVFSRLYNKSEQPGGVNGVNDVKSKDDRSHQIARFIGEGKSYEEIANILGMSLSEIQLFTSLLKKRITGK